MIRETDNRMEWFKKEARRLQLENIDTLIREATFQFDSTLSGYGIKYNLRELANE